MKRIVNAANGCRIKIPMVKEDDIWRIYERRNKGSQLRCIGTRIEYKPTKYNNPVQVTATARGKIYKELGAKVIAHAELPAGSLKSFDQLIVV